MLIEITRCRIETIVFHWTHCTNSSTNYRPQSASCSYYKSAPIESSISSGVPRTPRSRASLHGFQKGCVWARHCRARLSCGQLALTKPRAPLQCRPAAGCDFPRASSVTRVSGCCVSSPEPRIWVFPWAGHLKACPVHHKPPGLKVNWLNCSSDLYSIAMFSVIRN